MTSDTVSLSPWVFDGDGHDGVSKVGYFLFGMTLHPWTLHAVTDMATPSLELGPVSVLRQPWPARCGRQQLGGHEGHRAAQRLRATSGRQAGRDICVDGRRRDTGRDCVNEGNEPFSATLLQSCVKTFLISSENHSQNVPLSTPKPHYSLYLTVMFLHYSVYSLGANLALRIK